MDNLEQGQDRQSIKVSRAMLLFGLLVLACLIIFVILHVNEVGRFVRLAREAKPGWLALALALQIGTYMCAGGVWARVISPTGHRVSLKTLARFSMEKLSVDQLVPTGGVAGNLLVYQGMKLMGLPAWLALEALIVDTIAYYSGYLMLSLVVMATLWFHHEITPLVLYTAGIFAFVVLLIPALIIWQVKRQDKPLPRWLKRFKIITRIHEKVAGASPDRILNPKLLLHTSLLFFLIFLIDSATLWVVMRAISAPIGILPAVTAFGLAAMTGAISFLPGGVGGFEISAVATLTVLGTPLEAALAGTLLLRGLTLWIPLIPGLVLARRDVAISF